MSKNGFSFLIQALKKQGECDVQSENVHELHNQAPQVVLSANDQDPHEAQSEEDGNESAEGHVPLELFAEVRHFGSIMHLMCLKITSD